MESSYEALATRAFWAIDALIMPPKPRGHAALNQSLAQKPCRSARFCTKENARKP